ncbi:RAVE protein 1 C terminal-domain-containing protein [Pisolithus thermaeus]|nr:RAVE protein 1 C terminal-domain-containing protein [Pisolithus thermaeus]
MLELTRTFTGCPTGPLKYLVLPHANLIVYPSADAVVILNASSLSLVRVLALREVFPGTQQTVSCLAVDPALKVIVVSTGTRIAAWSLSGVQSNIFRVHSSLILRDGDPVTALDCRAGLLAIGSQKGLSVFTLILENDLLTWTKKWFTGHVDLVDLRPSLTPMNAVPLRLVRSHFSPTLAYIATTTTPNQVISHPRPVSDVLWRYSSTSRGPLTTHSDDPVLYTVTSDSVLRIFLPVIDSPHRLQLHLAIDSFTSLMPSNNLGVSSYSTSKIMWLDKEIIGPVVKTLLEGSSVDNRDVEMEKLREIDEEKLDLFIRVFGDGSLVFSAVANIDRKPPTLLRHFIISRSPPGAIYPSPSNIYILPHAELDRLTLVTSPPLRTFEVSALSLLSGQADSFLLCAAGLDKLPLQDSKISHFVRTPAGRGVAVVRESGGETWMVTDSGANLFQVKSWPSADHVVVLDGGRLIATYSADHSELLLHSNPPSVLTLPRISALFSAPSQSEHESIVGVTDEMSILHIHISTTPCPTLVLHSCDALPLPKRPKLILPVDPMAWSGTTISDYDHLLSISDDGELRFWILEHGKSSGWRCTGKVRTGRTKFTNARCSSAKKSVLVTRDADGQELTIWDSNESEFASGLEHRRIFSAAEPIHDLDWTSTPDNQSILAVGFTHRVELLCQQRKTYFDDDPGWVIYYKIEIGSFVPYPISDSIWLANGSFLVGAGHQMFLFSQTSSFARDTSCSLFESVARSNGPLDDYHPQMLLQCLLWGKLSLVKRIIVKMAQSFQTSNQFRWKPLPIEEYYGKEWTTHRAKPYDFLVGSTNQGELSEDQRFSRALVESLIEQLETHPLSHLTPNEHAHLIVLIQTTLEIDEQRRALDADGFRYVLSMRSFYILNRRIASDPNSPQSGGDVARKTGWRDRLRYRDMIWAFHSESQDILLNTSVAACNGKMLWSDARALGVFIWLNSVDCNEVPHGNNCSNQYMSGDLRDPTACSLFYFALGKFKLVHGLWRQAVWHKEQAIMLKFLSNDFTKPRWKTAALKNAYVLLSKQRFEYAAAFFLLGGSLKDAVSVCIKQLSDFQLAIALARVVEQGNDGPVFQGILRNTVLPMAWLCSWAFWMLRRRDLSVRVLLTPLQDIVDAFGISVKDVGEPYFDDPSLALLFSQLRSKTLQTATGTSEISGKSEFNFVLQVARVFCRMGSLTRDPFLLRRRSSIVIDMDIESRTPSGQSTPKARATVREEEPDRLARKAGLGSLIKSAKHDIQVPEFDLNAFF